MWQTSVTKLYLILFYSFHFFHVIFLMCNYSFTIPNKKMLEKIIVGTPTILWFAFLFGSNNVFHLNKMLSLQTILCQLFNSIFYMYGKLWYCLLLHIINDYFRFYNSHSCIYQFNFLDKSLLIPLSILNYSIYFLSIYPQKYFEDQKLDW
jgi:hypothetical protein